MSAAQAARIAELEARTAQLACRIEALSEALCLSAAAAGVPAVAAPIEDARRREQIQASGLRVLPGGVRTPGRPARSRRPRARASGLSVVTGSGPGAA